MRESPDFKVTSSKWTEENNETSTGIVDITANIRIEQNKSPEVSPRKLSRLVNQYHESVID
jgi:hypothetical protein